MNDSATGKKVRQEFNKEPNSFIEKAIKKFVRSSPNNRLAAFDGEPVFEAPLVGFANGDDRLFTEYKKFVHEEYLSPRDALALHIAEKSKTPAQQLENVSVISFVLPISKKTIRANAREKEGPSLRWNHSRWQGQDFLNELSLYLVSLLETMGAQAIAPELSPFFKIFRPPDAFSSNWSHRHAAYAAGLGTFSLSEGFITPKGMAMRCGSVVTNLKLESSARPYAHHMANCLFYASGKCGACIRRCPGAAISEKGHDKNKCFEVLAYKQKPWLDGEHGPGFIGKYAGCGLCQTGVPCASAIPKATNRPK